MYALAVGPFHSSEVEAFAAAAASSGVELALLHSALEARRHVQRKGALPHGVFVSRHADLASVARWVRDDASMFNVPVIALVAHPSDREFKQACAAGADDVLVEADAIGLHRRMQCLIDLDVAARPPAANGLALVATSNLRVRRRIGRTLRQAGFDVAFAAEARELVTLSRQSDPALVVATPSFPPLGGDAAVRSVRTATCKPDLPGLVMGGAHNPAAVERSGGDARGQLLFLADELLARRAAAEQRRSRRIQYSTICAFRVSGLMEPSYGLTHNLSREGLYVQTLDPPAAGSSLWLELRTPDGVPVHLRGKVMWRRTASQIGCAPPPGFGIKLEAVQCPPLDLASYVLGYDRLLEDREASN